MAPPQNTSELIWVSPLNTEFQKPGVTKKCPWRECLGKDIQSPHTRQDWKQKYPNGVFPDVLSMIGNTPLVKLNSIPQAEGLECNIWAKCEFVNPGGSIKDRMVKRMFEDAERQGLIKPGMTIIEPSSGNTGIAVALMSALKGYNCVIVMSEKISEEKEAVIISLGAKVVRVPVTEGSFDKTGLFGTAARLHKEIPNSFILDQFNHPGNPLTHYDTTANELLAQLDNKIDMVVFGGGTGGTVTGIGRKFREISPNTKLVGFDPEGSKFAYPDSLNTSDNKFWEIEGIGYEFVPGALDQQVCDYWVKINDMDALPMGRRLMKEEGLLVGMSAGAAVAAAVKAAKGLKKGQNVVVFMPDSIRNYMTKFVSDRWMEAKGYQPCENKNNLWWWDKPVSSIKYAEPELINSKDTLAFALAHLENKNRKEAVVIDPKENMLGTVTIETIRNKLISGLLQPTDLVERCTTRILPKLDNNSILGRAFRIIEGDKFAVIVDIKGSGDSKVEVPLGIIYGEHIYSYIEKGQ
ncbi:cystathionine beta-synthase-like [Anthonomus grandis grandis]|uniref:cystathionine beta-synthase-like n=1 Tax=Anthonomus grandis grandis TaxID=2921223 RepID=UPI002165ACA7|nr:cystathionine beta-synthase-like [Anthonomus grandis grandis]XP_050303425.1 cystathionine beta-synthase-like [Anthonomus grandis grandis]